MVGIPFVAAGTAGAMLGKLFTFFLKAGSLTFGSGLVIVPFLEKGLVQQTGWLNEREFLVAVAMGMISPGPVVITATFVGYLVAGFWGAIGTILGACVLLGRIAIGDWLTVLVALVSLVVLFRWKVSNPLLVAAAAVIGLIAFPLLRPEWIFVK
jgi:chromate transporter